MHLLDNYLDPLYKDRDIYDGLLRYYGAHQDLNKIHDNLVHNAAVTNFKDYQHLFECVFLKYYNEFSDSVQTYTVGERMLNILNVNTTQYKKLQQNNGKITYTVVWDDNMRKNNLLYEKHIQVNPNLFSDFKTRCFTLYHRSGNHCSYLNDDVNHNFGVDIFQFIIIYRTVHKMIIDKKTKLFNDIKIVSRYNKLPNICFDLLNKYCTNNRESCFKQSSGDQFIIDTCFFSNTLHFWGGELPDSFFHNIPIITYDHLIQNNYMNHIHNKHVLPFLYYAGNVSLDGNIHIEDKHKDYFIDNDVHNFLYMINKAKNKYEPLNISVENIVKETIKCVVSLENKLINDEII